ncbi:MAG TPA: TerB family tellurite resistance protein [Gammaproteobacteria bacterium]|jgi:uncharacterized tellurite resistance protein B-like protein
MFDSLKHWLDTLKQESRLFTHADEEVLHAALASLLFHVISADQQVGDREKREFTRIMKQEFDLNAEQIEHLFQAASASAGDPQADLRTIAAHLKRNPSVRMSFMKKLLQLIDVDGTRSDELKLFYDALREIFPGVSEVARDYDPRAD